MQGSAPPSRVTVYAPLLLVVAAPAPVAHFTCTVASASARPVAAVPDTCRLATGVGAGGVTAGGACVAGASPLPPPHPAISKATAPAAMDIVRELNFML